MIVMSSLKTRMIFASVRIGLTCIFPSCGGFGFRVACYDWSGIDFLVLVKNVKCNLMLVRPSVLYSFFNVFVP